MCIGHVGKEPSVLLCVRVYLNLCGNLYVHLHGVGYVRLDAYNSLQLQYRVFQKSLRGATAKALPNVHAITGTMQP